MGVLSNRRSQKQKSSMWGNLNRHTGFWYAMCICVFTPSPSPKSSYRQTPCSAVSTSTCVIIVQPEGTRQRYMRRMMGKGQGGSRSRSQRQGRRVPAPFCYKLLSINQASKNTNKQKSASAAFPAIAAFTLPVHRRSRGPTCSTWAPDLIW